MLCVIGIATMSGCKKDEEENEAKYTFRTDMTFLGYEGYEPDYYYILFECDQSGSKIKNNRIEPVIKGKEYTFTADKNATKVKVYYHYSVSTLYSTTKWVQQVFTLEKGKNTPIVLNGETLVGVKEP